MNRYQLHNTNSGCILGEYKGETPYEALLAMLTDAGYTGDDLFEQVELADDIKCVLIDDEE